MPLMILQALFTLVVVICAWSMDVSRTRCMLIAWAVTALYSVPAHQALQVTAIKSLWWIDWCSPTGFAPLHGGPLSDHTLYRDQNPLDFCTLWLEELSRSPILRPHYIK